MFRRKRSAEDFAEEIKAHLELEADDLRHEGLSADEARRRARSEFGNLGAARERFYMKDRWVSLDRLLGDVRFALRSLRKSPGFAATAMVTLALGIGANTAIFTLVHAILLRNLPVVDPKALVRVGDHEDCCILNESASSREGSYSIFSYETYKYLRDHTPEFEQLAAVEVAARTFRRGGLWVMQCRTRRVASLSQGIIFRRLGCGHLQDVA